MSAEVRVGIVAPGSDTRDMLRAQIQALGLASVEVEADQYCVGYADRVTRRLIDARPDVVVVDLQDSEAGLHTLRILHASLPAAWLFVTSAANDSLLIIDAMRAGAREYLMQPLSARALAQAFARYLSARERDQRQHDIGKLYCVTAVKGGAGATTVAVSLAAALAGSSETRTALLDLHAPMGDAAGYLNMVPQYTLSDVLGSIGRLDSVLLKSMMSRSEALSVLPGPRESWSETGITPAALSRVLEVLLEGASHTFSDVPAALDRELLRTVVEASTAMIVVLTSELPALWRAQRLTNTLKDLGMADKLRLVLNRSRRGEEVSDREIEKTLGQTLYWKLPNNYPAAVKAINSGEPMTRGQSSDLASSLETLARRLTGVNLGERRRGLLGGLLSFSTSTRPSNA